MSAEMGITMTNLEKAHKINRILMRKLHSVCEEYGVTYFYDSGALIGAVRHHDFIHILNISNFFK